MIAQSNTQKNEGWAALMIAFHKGYCFNGCYNTCMGTRECTKANAMMRNIP